MSLEQTLAIAIADEFWRTAERPKTWAAHGQNERQVWMNCATAAVAAAKAFKAAQQRTPQVPQPIREDLKSSDNPPTPTTRGVA